MIVSPFDPLKHGLPYKNGSFKFHVGAAPCSVLCGGISYAALDYFFLKINPPQSPKTPAEGNPMEEYLYMRQKTAHYYTWHRFANAWTISQSSVLANSPLGEQDSLDNLCTHLASRPVILCLFGKFHGHHVVAWACDPGKKEILLYDSNFPGKSSGLKQVSDGWLHKPSEQMWKGWFIDWGHHTEGARMPPLPFRYCRTCHGLNTTSLGVQGGCLSGNHNNHPDFEYFLPWQSGEGQGGWIVCGKCQGLYRPMAGDTAICPAGGLHVPQQQNGWFKDLYVSTNGTGEAGWRRCGGCTSLFWMKSGSDLGKCTSAGVHSPVPSESYVVNCRTV
jgi:hypothetical protein